MAGEQAFTAGLRAARAVGGPPREIDTLATRPPVPDVGFLGRMSRMTLGIQRLMQRRSAMPEPMDSAEIAAFFLRGRELFATLESYDVEGQAWLTEASREAWDGIMLTVNDALAAASEQEIGRIAPWLSRELDIYHRLTHGDEEDETKGQSMAAGASGSRVGWWLRAVEAICTQYGHLSPAGADVTAWAIWEFPLNDYLALQPAALERAGCELPEHYAVKEARRARRKAKAAAAAQTPAPEAATPNP